MHTAIITAHPWHGSFNRAILHTVIDQLNQRNKAYVLIDLNKDGFDPVLKEEELALFSKGESLDPLVRHYQEVLTNADELVFIFPIWWFDLPAILKGFFDKVMLKHYAYVETSTGLKGLLTHVNRTTVISTSELPTWYLKWLSGNPIKGTFVHSTLRGIGLKRVRWLNNGSTTSGSQQQRQRFLKKVAAHLSI